VVLEDAKFLPDIAKSEASKGTLSYNVDFRSIRDMLHFLKVEIERCIARLELG
jgi:hypothetical protein